MYPRPTLNLPDCLHFPSAGMTGVTTMPVCICGAENGPQGFLFGNPELNRVSSCHSPRKEFLGQSWHDGIHFHLNSSLPGAARFLWVLDTVDCAVTLSLKVLSTVAPTCLASALDIESRGQPVLLETWSQKRRVEEAGGGNQGAGGDSVVKSTLSCETPSFCSQHLHGGSRLRNPMPPLASEHQTHT